MTEYILKGDFHCELNNSFSIRMNYVYVTLSNENRVQKK